MGEVVLESVSAQIMALPLILYIFNDSSYIVLLANVLVVPLIPIAMLFSFIAGMAGVLVPAFSGWLAWPAKIILTYLLDVATLVSKIPSMQFSVDISAATMIMMYAIVVAVIIIWWHKINKTDKITDIKETNFLN
jgi:competence protein ComEC